jgi:hypothetical protein
MNSVSHEFLTALRDASVFTAELPESAVFDTLDALEFYEHSLVIRNGAVRPIVVADYALASANYPDEVRVYGEANNQVLVSADHASDPFKKSTNTYREADHGTGGLAMLVAERGAQSVIPVGKQTANVAVSPDSHPLKQKIGQLLPTKVGFISLHGMIPGKLLELNDKTEIHAIIGLGAAPNQESRDAAARIIRAASDLDLRVIVGNDVRHRMHDPDTNEFKRDANGDIRTGELRAHRTEMTTNYAYRVMEQTGQQIPSLQMEMTRLLRLLPSDFHGGWHKDRKAQAMGVHLGYLLSQAAIAAVSR